MQEEEFTSGIEEILDWDLLEEMLSNGEFADRAGVRVWLETLFVAADRPYADYTHEQVLAGMFEEARAAYRSLPKIRPAILTEDNVREIRSRHAQGERPSQLAREFGVRHNTVGDIVHRRTWKGVA
jgi:hypothetical protein